MNLDRRPPTEAPYLSHGERTVLSSRLHPIVAVLPFIYLAAATYGTLFVMSLYGVIGTVLVLAAFIQWARLRGLAFGLSFWWSVGIFTAVTLYIGLATNPANVVYVLILIGLVVAIYQLVEYFLTTIYLTDKRVFRVSGVLTRTIATMPLRALTDIRYDRPLIGRLFFDYGHFHVESAGQNQALSKILFVRDSDHFYRKIMTQAFSGNSRT